LHFQTTGCKFQEIATPPAAARNDIHHAFVNSSRIAAQTASTCASVITLENGRASPRLPKSSVIGKSP
jgi:hypothetical protein